MWPRSGIVKQLQEGGLAVSSDLLSRTSLNLNALSKNPTVANVTRIIGFQSLEQLLPREKGLHAIRLLEASQDFLVEALAETASYYIANNVKGAISILDMLLQSDIASHISEVNAVRTKIVINYLSQMILSEDDIEEPIFFKSLEHVTAGYCNHITSTRYAGPEQAHEAARMQYNLYFIMDHVASRRPKLFKNAMPIEFLLEQRHSTAKLAAKYQQEKIPDNHRLEMKHKLHQGWYEFDSGHLLKAADIFLTIAETADVIASEDEGLVVNSISLFRIWHFDSLCLAIAINPNLLDNKEVAHKASRLVKRYGGFKNISLLGDFLQQKSTSLQPRYLAIDIPSSIQLVKIYYTIYDLFSALFIADSLFFNLGFVPKLVFITDIGKIKRHLKEKCWLHVFVGSPDTPGGMGQIIGSLDPDLIQIYQSKLHCDFALPFRACIDDQKIIVTLASGLGAIAEAWSKAMSSPYQFPELEKRMENPIMELTLLSSVLSHVLKKLGERATNTLIDKIGTAINKRSATGSEESKQNLEIHALRQYSELLKKGTDAQALSELRNNLHRPQFRAFIEIANLQGLIQLIDLELQQLTDKVPDVQPSDYIDMLETMVYICDYLRNDKTLRHSDITRINTFQTQINLHRKNLSLINDKMAAAADVEEQLYSTDTKIRTLFSGFSEMCQTIIKNLK